MIRAISKYYIQNGSKMQEYTSTVEGETFTEIYFQERDIYRQLKNENEYIIKVVTYYSYK